MRLIFFFFLFLCSASLLAQQKNSSSLTIGTNKIKLNIHFEEKFAGDTVFFEYWPAVLKGSHPVSTHNGSLPFFEKSVVLDQYGRAFVEFLTKGKNGYLALAKDWTDRKEYHIPIINLFFVEAGDNVTIEHQTENLDSTSLEKEKGYALKFAGWGSKKYTCQYEIFALLAKQGPPAITSEHFEYMQNSFALNWLNESMQILKKYAGKITPTALNVIKSDIIGEAGNYILDDFLHARIKTRQDSSKMRILRSVFLEMVNKDFSFTIFPSVKHISKNYPGYILKYEKTKYLMENNSLQAELYYKIKGSYTGILREKMLTILIIEGSKISFDPQILKDALSLLRIPVHKDEINQATARLKGATAYPFTLPNTEGKLVSLQDFKGKVVFIDFWNKHCFACIDYYQQAVKPVEELFQNNKEVVFISISSDVDKADWVNGVKRGLWTSEEDNIINLYTGGKGIEHPVFRHYYIYAAPVPILVDKEGKIFEFDQGLRSKDGLIKTINEALK